MSKDYIALERIIRESLYETDFEQEGLHSAIRDVWMGVPSKPSNKSNRRLLLEAEEAGSLWESLIAYAWNKDIVGNEDEANKVLNDRAKKLLKQGENESIAVKIAQKLSKLVPSSAKKLLMIQYGTGAGGEESPKISPAWLGIHTEASTVPKTDCYLNNEQFRFSLKKGAAQLASPQKSESKALFQAAIKHSEKHLKDFTPAIRTEVEKLLQSIEKGFSVVKLRLDSNDIRNIGLALAKSLPNYQDAKITSITDKLEQDLVDAVEGNDTSKQLISYLKQITGQKETYDRLENLFKTHENFKLMAVFEMGSGDIKYDNKLPKANYMFNFTTDTDPKVEIDPLYEMAPTETVSHYTSFDEPAAAHGGSKPDLASLKKLGKKITNIDISIKTHGGRSSAARLRVLDTAMKITGEITGDDDVEIRKKKRAEFKKKKEEWKKSVATFIKGNKNTIGFYKVIQGYYKTSYFYHLKNAIESGKKNFDGDVALQDTMNFFKNGKKKCPWVLFQPGKGITPEIVNLAKSSELTRKTSRQRVIEGSKGKTAKDFAQDIINTAFAGKDNQIIEEIMGQYSNWIVGVVESSIKEMPVASVMRIRLDDLHEDFNKYKEHLIDKYVLIDDIYEDAIQESKQTQLFESIKNPILNEGVGDWLIKVGDFIKDILKRVWAKLKVVLDKLWNMGVGAVIDFFGLEGSISW